jgi:hypothetical protein
MPTKSKKKKKSVNVDAPGTVISDTSNKYQLGATYSVPTTVAESGFVYITGCEKAESSRRLGGAGWVYHVKAVPLAGQSARPMEPWFTVYESEFEQWQSKPISQ